jgi:hypothetical protein
VFPLAWGFPRNYTNNQSGFGCQESFFALKLQFQANLSPPAAGLEDLFDELTLPDKCGILGRVLI